MNWRVRGQDATGLERLEVQVGEAPPDHADALGVAGTGGEGNGACWTSDDWITTTIVHTAGLARSMPLGFEFAPGALHWWLEGPAAEPGRRHMGNVG